MLKDNVKQSELKPERSAAAKGARVICFAVGLFLLTIAIVVPSDGYSQALSGGTKDLTWGPILFRALLGFHGIAIAVLAAIWLKQPERSDAVHADRQVGPMAWAVMAGLTIAAVLLRLWNLNSAPWIDEILTLVDFVRLPINEIVISFPSQNQHMLYSILARGSFALFGESTWALRLPAVMFGIGSIWALFFFARHVSGTRAALLACAVMTVSYHHVWFSQNARGYTGLLMMSLLATWTWLEALRSNTWNWWALYTAAVVGGMWIHMTMAFVVAAQGIVYLIFLTWPGLSGDGAGGAAERRAGIKPIVAWVLSATLTLQVYALALPQFLATGLHEESRNSEWTNPFWVLKESIENLSIGFAGSAVVIIAAAFVIFGWISIFLRNRRAAILMILPPVLSGGLMLALGHNLFPRFFFFAMGFALLIVIHGTLELPKVILGSASRFQDLARFAPKVGVGFALFMIGASLLTVPRNYSMPKQDFAGARDYVRENLTQSSGAVAVNIAGDMFAKYYAPDWVTTRDISQLNQLQRGNKAVWLVYTMPFEIQAFSPELWKTIQDDYEIVRTFPGTLNGGEVVVCRQRRSLVKQ